MRFIDYFRLLEGSMLKIRIIGLLFFMSTALLALEQLYFMPQDGKAFKQALIAQIDQSDRSVKIAIYNLKSDAIANALNAKAKSGVPVIVYYFKKDVTLDPSVDQRNVTSRKLHTKMGIFDDTVVLFGSANWAKASFYENYDMGYITDDPKVVEESVAFFNRLTP
jgi:phosphatidylserine/phosphatidylglycerophosphate/cardiolipin synthase-like enzyme